MLTPPPYPPSVHERNCRVCDAAYTTRHPTQRYCSARCKRAAEPLRGRHSRSAQLGALFLVLVGCAGLGVLWWLPGHGHLAERVRHLGWWPMGSLGLLAAVAFGFYRLTYQ